MLPVLPPIWFEIEIFLILSSAALCAGLLVGWLLKADLLHHHRWTTTLSE